jgi:uncharacterized protein YdhG (YjbR/CyaY superfamily)
MNNFEEYLLTLEEGDRRERMASIFSYIRKEFPFLKEEVKWKQPMFADHGTFIIGFSVSKGHISVGSERPCLEKFKEDIEKAQYPLLKELFQIPFDSPVDFELLHKIIAYNIEDKKDVTVFWR